MGRRLLGVEVTSHSNTNSVITALGVALLGPASDYGFWLCLTPVCECPFDCLTVFLKKKPLVMALLALNSSIGLLPRSFSIGL